MTWREDLRRVRIAVNGKALDLVGASFRGVPFFVESSDRSGGRRTVVHEFPLRDEPFIEDLGRRGRKFPVSGFVIGDDYLTQRDQLLAALEDEEGPGQLVHPYHGIKSAICDTVQVHEERANGGMAHFAIDFIEAPAQAPTPTIEDDTAGKVSSSADNALLAVDAELVQKLDPAGQPAFALASAETALRNAAAGLGAKLAPAAQAAAQVAGDTADFAAAVTQELAAMTGQIALVTAQAASLVRRPADIVTAFRAAITALGDTAAAAPGAVMGALVAAYATDLGPPAPTTTATRARELANQQALTGALRRVIAIEAARLAPLVPYATIEDATAARDEIAALLDDQAQGAGDTAYPALVTLRSDVLRAVPGGGTFARVVTVTRRVATSSLLLAYQLYGAVDLELDVIARNKVAARHPGFIAGDLKVLSNGG